MVKRIMANFDAATLSLIDANANRAREGIRTAEDYIRFSVRYTRWALELKAIRAGITAVVNSHVAERELIASRNVPGDPGRPKQDPIRDEAQSANSERPIHVARRGLKRAQEALRVLEEYFRAQFAQSSTQLSQYRYVLYEAEQWLMLGSAAATTLGACSVYVLLTESLCARGLLPTAEAALKGGCKLFQLREKQDPGTTLITKARDLQRLCSEYDAVLICNDRVDVAAASGCVGVHVGQDDLAPADIRSVIGQKLLIGRSTHSVGQAKRAIEQEQVDYIAIGSMYDTTTKPQRIMAGLSLAEQVSALKTDLPVFAIGGITLERIPELKAAGVRRIAVSSVVISAADPEGVTRKLIEAMDGV